MPHIDMPPFFWVLSQLQHGISQIPAGFQSQLYHLPVVYLVQTIKPLFLSPCIKNKDLTYNYHTNASWCYYLIICLYILTNLFLCITKCPVKPLHQDSLLLIETQYALCHHLTLGTTAIKENPVYQWLREDEVSFLHKQIQEVGSLGLIRSP